MNAQNAWVLSCPAPKSGRIVEGYYNAGPIIADDRNGPTPEDTKVQIIAEVSLQDYENYIDQLKAEGGNVYLENQIADDLFFAYEHSGKNYHVRFCAKRGEIRVAEEPDYVSPTGFGYKAAGPEQTTLYQYGLYYDPNNNMTPKTANCGMLYIIKLSDNSLFMMDAGFYLQWKDEAIDGLWQFLRQITNTPEDGIVRISAWYFTHTHADHIDGCAKLLRKYHENIVIDRLLYNFPHYAALGGYEPSIYYVKEQIAAWYPHCKFLKLHTGQKLDLADMNVEVFYTQEDAISEGNMSKFPLRDGNCMSSILKLTIGGKTAMMLGDTNIEAEAWIAENSAPGPWKSDMVQLAHHCFNYLDTLYEWIEAPVVLVPNSYGGAHQPENAPKLYGAEKFAKDGQVFYEGGGTDGFIAAEDGWKHVFHAPVIGGEFDGTGYWD